MIGSGVNNPMDQELCAFLLKQLEVAVFFTNPEGTITGWSPGVERLLGYTEDEFLGQHASIIFTLEDRALGLDAAEFEKAGTTGRSSDTRWHRRKDGSSIFVDGILTAMKDADGQPVGYVKIVRNVFPDRIRQRVAYTILEGTNEAISVKDRKGRYAFINARMAGIFGSPAEEIIGHTLQDFQPSEVSSPISEDDQSVMAGGHPRSIEERLLTKDHGMRTFLSSKAPLKNLEGATIGVVCISLDITARKQFAEERDRLVRELRRSNEDLAQFSYVVSHDLQAPLRTVRNYTELLARQCPANADEPANQFIGFILNGTRQMQDLIQQLLQFAQIGEGTLQLERVDTNAILAGVRLSLDGLVRENAAEIRSAPLPAVLGDPVQLMQLFQNLIGNALQYSRSGVSPLVLVSAEEIAGNLYKFSVRDNGVGIDPAQFDLIFAPLRRLHGPENPGAGMGLAICRKVVERHGGTIWVESRPGQGSTFYFTLRTA